MDSWEALINKVSLEVKACESALQSELRNLGEHLSSMKEDVFSGSDFEKLFQEAKQLRDTIPQTSRIKERILKAAGRRKDLQDKLKRSKDVLSRAARDKDTAYEKIGELAFAEYDRERLEYPSIAKVLSEFADVREDKREIDNELERYQHSVSRKGFWKKLADAGRIAYLRTSRSVLQRRLPLKFRAAGEALCTQQVGDLSEGAFADLLSLCREKEARFAQARKENLKLLKDEEKIEEELKNLGGGITYQSSVRSLEKQIRLSSQRLEEVYRSLGEAYREKPPAKPTGKIAGILSKIDKFERKRAENNHHIERLRAAIEIKKLADQNLGLSEKVKELEKSIERKQREVEKIRAGIDQKKMDISRLKKVRGQEESLDEEPDGEQ